MKKLLFCLVTVALFASCSTSKDTSDTLYRYDETSAEKVQLKPQGIMNPIIADLTVASTKVSYEQTFLNDLDQSDVNNPDNSPKIQFMKSTVMAAALKKVNADVLVSPIFEIKTNTTQITVSVVGYPGTYSNFRNATKADYEFNRAIGTVEAPAPQPGTTTPGVDLLKFGKK